MNEFDQLQHEKNTGGQDKKRKRDWKFIRVKSTLKFIKIIDPLIEKRKRKSRI